MKTTQQTACLLGRRGEYRVRQTLSVRVMIRDVRSVFNRVDYLVQPIAGTGTAWVAAETVTVDGEES